MELLSLLGNSPYGTNAKGTNYGMLWSLEKSEILSRSNFQVCNEFCLIYIVLFGVGARINLFCRETSHLSGLLKCTSLLEDKLPRDWGFCNKPAHSRYTTSQGSE